MGNGRSGKKLADAIEIARRPEIWKAIRYRSDMPPDNLYNRLSTLGYRWDVKAQVWYQLSERTAEQANAETSDDAPIIIETPQTERPAQLMLPMRPNGHGPYLDKNVFLIRVTAHIDVLNNVMDDVAELLAAQNIELLERSRPYENFGDDTFRLYVKCRKEYIKPDPPAKKIAPKPPKLDETSI